MWSDLLFLDSLGRRSSEGGINGFLALDIAELILELFLLIKSLIHLGSLSGSLFTLLGGCLLSRGRGFRSLRRSADGSIGTRSVLKR